MAQEVCFESVIPLMRILLRGQPSMVLFQDLIPSHRPPIMEAPAETDFEITRGHLLERNYLPIQSCLT